MSMYLTRLRRNKFTKRENAAACGRHHPFCRPMGSIPLCSVINRWSSYLLFMFNSPLSSLAGDCPFPCMVVNLTIRMVSGQPAVCQRRQNHPHKLQHQQQVSDVFFFPTETALVITNEEQKQIFNVFKKELSITMEVISFYLLPVATIQKRTCSLKSWRHQ